jgi:hypothetical protein
MFNSNPKIVSLPSAPQSVLNVKSSHPLSYVRNRFSDLSSAHNSVSLSASTSKSGASLIHFCNINGLLGKRAQIKTVLSQPPFTAVMALCETHIAKDYKGSLKIKDYVVHSVAHTSHSSGIVVYVHKGFPCAHLDSLTLVKRGSMCTFVDVCLSNTLTLRVGVVYLKPDCSVGVLRAIPREWRRPSLTGVPFF